MELVWRSLICRNNFVKQILYKSTRRLSVTKTQITPLLTLREVNNPHQNEGTRDAQCKPIVLLFDWLYAQQSALNKYCDLYHNLGLDVITVKGKLVHFLWPPKGEDLAKSLMNYLLNERPSEEKLVIHAFSVGAYNYTICKTLGLEQPEVYGAFRDKVIAQIFDSIVLGSYENMSTGISEAFNKGGNLAKPIVALMDLYYHVTDKHTKVVYDKLVKNFKECPIEVPTLVFYSKNDPMCHVPSMEEMINNWEKNFPHFDVTVQFWGKSVHAAHLKFHQDEYLKCWRGLLGKVLK